MYLQYITKLTTEVIPVNNKFVFNQEVTLKQNFDKDFFEIVVHLVTDKGATYIAGVIKIK
jgi:hypothetical protein